MQFTEKYRGKITVELYAYLLILRLMPRIPCCPHADKYLWNLSALGRRSLTVVMQNDGDFVEVSVV